MSVVYLSSDWIDAADSLLRSTVIDPPMAGDAFTVETCVVGATDGDRRYVIEFDGATVRARRARPGEHATVRLTQDYATAVAVARGELSAQAAFLAADIQVGGDVSTLIANAGLIAQVGDALAPLRADTRFDVTQDA